MLYRLQGIETATYQLQGAPLLPNITPNGKVLEKLSKKAEEAQAFVDKNQVYITAATNAINELQFLQDGIGNNPESLFATYENIQKVAWETAAPFVDAILPGMGKLMTGPIGNVVRGILNLPYKWVADAVTEIPEMMAVLTKWLTITQMDTMGAYILQGANFEAYLAYSPVVYGLEHKGWVQDFRGMQRKAWDKVSEQYANSRNFGIQKSVNTEFFQVACKFMPQGDLPDWKYVIDEDLEDLQGNRTDRVLSTFDPFKNNTRISIFSLMTLYSQLLTSGVEPLTDKTIYRKMPDGAYIPISELWDSDDNNAPVYYTKTLSRDERVTKVRNLETRMIHPKHLFENKDMFFVKSGILVFGLDGTLGETGYTPVSQVLDEKYGIKDAPTYLEVINKWGDSVKSANWLLWILIPTIALLVYAIAKMKSKKRKK